MNISSAKLIYFSPTRTTRRVLESIANGTQVAAVEHVDLTLLMPGTPTQAEIHDDLVIIGSPVYAGRLPHDLASRMRHIRGNHTPAIIVVVYGNRAYEDALLELRDLAVKTGFSPVAAGAFIGEHSFSTDAAPIAAGRPDKNDLGKAEEFGRMVREKMRNKRAPDEMVMLQVPGNFPYKDRSGLSNISPVTRESECAKCEKCAAVCPTEAIMIRDTVVTDTSVCIRCCACVKICSTGARTMEDPRIRQIAERLSTTCKERKEPELYL